VKPYSCYFKFPISHCDAHSEINQAFSIKNSLPLQQVFTLQGAEVSLIEPVLHNQNDP